MGQFAAPIAVASSLASGVGMMQQAKLQRKQAALERNKQKRQYDEKRRKLERDKKQAKAQARARFAAQGRSVQDGSAAALITGLNRRAHEDLQSLTEDYKAGYQSALLSEQNGRLSNLSSLLSTGKQLTRYF